MHGNNVGGTNPALLEGMVTSPRVLAIDVPFSKEVLGDNGYFLTLDNAAKSLRDVITYPADQQVGRNGHEQACTSYFTASSNSFFGVKCLPPDSTHDLPDAIRTQ